MEIIIFGILIPPLAYLTLSIYMFRRALTMRNEELQNETESTNEELALSPESQEAEEQPAQHIGG